MSRFVLLRMSRSQDPIRGLRAPTQAMADTFTSLDNQLDEYVEAFTAADNQVGLVFATGSHIIGTELFAIAD